MIKLVFVVRRRTDVSPADFRKYRLEQHGPLVRSYAAALRARRYIQSHTLDTELNGYLCQARGMTDSYDGITEVWWDSLQDLAAAAGSPEGTQANLTLIQDEARFVDLARSSIFLTEEHTIFDN